MSVPAEPSDAVSTRIPLVSDLGEPAEPPLSLRARLVGTVAVAAVLLLVGILFFAVELLQATSQARNVIDVLTPATQQSNRVLVAMVDQETGLRGYALTGEQAFLRPYQTGREDQRDAERQLADLVADSPELRERAESVHRLAERWRVEIAEPIRQLVADQGVGAVGTDRLEAGRRDFEQFRAEISALQDELRSQRAVARAEFDTAVNGLLVTFTMGAVLIAVGFVLTVVLLRSWVTGPLSRLAAGAKAVVGGDIQHRIRADGPAEIVALGADIEAMRRRVVADLEEANRARAELAAQAALTEAQAAELKRSNTDLEQFAYVASHDLQEPLRKVASFCQLLERRYGDQLDERGRQYTAFAVDGAKRMQRLINDLLAFSRVGRTTTSFGSVRCADAVDRATQSLAGMVEETGAEVRLDGELPTVPGDLALLAQVFQNLIGNAIKFRGADPPKVTLSAYLDEVAAEWVLSCTDNGIGVSAEYADKIFVIFQRLHGRNEYTGTGIGLALCRKIVEFHDGRIWLDTGFAGPGTRICFTLPSPDKEYLR